MGKHSGFCFQEKVTKYQESILGARTIMDEQKYSLKPKSLSSSVSKAGMVFVFYLKFVRLRDQLTVETRRNLDPCQIDNFVSGLILSLLTDCRPCPAPGPPSASAARWLPALREINITNKPTLRQFSHFKEIKIIHQTHNYNSCKSFPLSITQGGLQTTGDPSPLIETGLSPPQVDHSHVNFHSFLLHQERQCQVQTSSSGCPLGIHCKYCK